MEQPVDVQMETESPDIPAGADHAPGDLLLEHWPRLAATAWEGFLLSGPGSVAVTLGEHGPDFTTARDRRARVTRSLPTATTRTPSSSSSIRATGSPPG